MTEQQIKWAASHDWCLGRVGDNIEVVDRYTTADGSYHEDKYLWTKSFAELRDWAGY